MAEYNDFNDAELVNLLNLGDHKAYTAIFNRYNAVLYSHAYNKLRDEAEARDVVQEIFLTLWSQHKEFD